jgi:hypothetical protein
MTSSASILILLLLATPQTLAGHLLAKRVLPPKMVSITVHVDYGPAGKPAVRTDVTIPEGATPKEALQKIFPVEEGKICCHAGEVKGINGVSVDPLKNRWWRLRINGTSKNASPQKTRLNAGDLMEWIYFEDAQ